MRHTQPIIALFLTAATSCNAFAPTFVSRRTLAPLNSEIVRADEIFEAVDPSEGGVGLAKESAIKICGEVEVKGGSAEAISDDLIRYTGMKEMEESKVISILDKVGGKILCFGSGVEDYRDPGSSTEQIIVFAPTEAAEKALQKLESAVESPSLVLNFLGGDDLIMGQVWDAASLFVEKAAPKSKAAISFNSLCYKDIAMGICSLAAVALGESESSDEFTGAEKSVAAGEVYFYDGKWWTVDEADINLQVD